MATDSLLGLVTAPSVRILLVCFLVLNASMQMLNIATLPFFILAIFAANLWSYVPVKQTSDMPLHHLDTILYNSNKLLIYLRLDSYHVGYTVQSSFY